MKTKIYIIALLISVPFLNFGQTNNLSLSQDQSSLRNQSINPSSSDKTLTSTTTITWNGETNSDWNTASNWDFGVPNATSTVRIPNVGNDPIIYEGSYNVYELTLESGATLDIYSGSSLSCLTDMNLEHGASLIDNGNLIINGNAYISKSISNNQWHLISSPVSNATHTMFSENSLQTWDESDAWWYEVNSLDMILIPAQGYGFSPSGSAYNTHTFIGTPNTGEQNIALINEIEGENYCANLVGNPYPSSIDWSKLDDTYGAINYYNGTSYLSWNNGNGSGIQNIPPMQGFFIVPNDRETFSVQNSDRSHEGSSNYYKSETAVTNGLVIAASNGSYDDELWIKIDDDAHEDFDFRYDSYKFFTNVEGISQIYSKYNDQNFSIDVRPESGSIALGFKNDLNGLYSIRLKQIDGIQDIKLEDTKQNYVHDLRNGAYEFDWDSNDLEERFILHLNATATEELVEQDAQVYSHNAQLYIQQSSSNLFNSIAIYDLAGRVVYTGNLNQDYLQNIEINSLKGVYLVQLYGENNSLTKKVSLK